jgi:hypothetical protein
MRPQAETEDLPRPPPTMVEIELAFDQVRYFRREGGAA